MVTLVRIQVVQSDPSWSLSLRTSLLGDLLWFLCSKISELTSIFIFSLIVTFKLISHHFVLEVHLWQWL